MSDDFENNDQNEFESISTDLVPADGELPLRLLLVPIFGRPLFPGQMQPVVLEADTWRSTLKRVTHANKPYLGLVYAGNEYSQDQTNPINFPKIGTLVRVHKLREEDGRIHFMAQSLDRFEVEFVTSKRRPIVAEVSYPTLPQEDPDELKGYAMSIVSLIKELVTANPLYSEELKQFLGHFNLNQPSPLADFAATITSAPGEQLQKALETVPLIARMTLVLELLRKELEVARIQQRISTEVEEQMSAKQRDFFLREQLKAIQSELGITRDDRNIDIERIESRLAELDVPEHVKERVDEEMGKLRMLEPSSSEYGVTRGYLDWISQVPWGKYSEDSLNLEKARDTLDEHHAGLDDVKDRILEFIAEGVFRGTVAGSIILLVGPPGVGKTSIGKSIAECLDREFYRFSVGGMRDEAEIKGHRRTYIGAMPGKLVQALKLSKVSNPVIMLDEIDKIGASHQGDPASALLEVLDPEQNKDFLDHYLDLRLDLSKCIFVCTANTVDTIPRPLLDRMDIIRLSGYITNEKVDIARKHLWPRLLKRAGVKTSQIKITDSALRALVEGYARESGVRNLEKQLHKALRKAMVVLLGGEQKSLTINNKNLVDFLGHPVFKPDSVMQGVGVVTGLAWTAMGGATLAIEAIAQPSKNGGIQLTGKLGEVMQESAQIARSYVQSKASKYKVESDWIEKHKVHLHVPEGATPKDGPSAGVTMATALISLASGRRVKDKLAMTGELTLTGHVLPVGGIREKVIAARRIGVKIIVLPEANRSDYEELPDYLKEDLTAHFASRYKDVYQVAFD